MKIRRAVGGFGLAAAGALVLILSLALPAQSQTWLLDFGTTENYRSASVVNPDSNGHYWNSVDSWNWYAGLVDINGNATAAATGFNADGGDDSYNGPAGTTFDPAQAQFNAAALGDLGTGAAVFDYYVNSQFNIQGLDPTKQYTLSFYGSHSFSDDATTKYTVYSDASFSTVLQAANLNVQDPVSPWLFNQDTVATLNGVSPDAGGGIYIGFTGADGGSGYLNAMEITTVPEPTTVMLVGFGAGLLGLLGLRRRHTS